MTSGTAPNTSIVLSPDELRFIERKHQGSKSAAIHQALAQAMQPLKTDEGLELSPRVAPFIERLTGMHEYDLDDCIQAIYHRKREIMAERLRHAGFGVRTEFNVPAGWGSDERVTIKITCLLIDDPNGGTGEYYTLDEARRLLGTVANLTPGDAFARMRQKIEPFNEGRPYSRQDAERDMRAERLELHRQYQAGQIDGEILGIALRQTSDYLGYIEPDKTSEQIEIREEIQE